MLVIGAEGELSVNGGTWGAPIWGENTLVREVRLPSPWDFAEFTDRSTPVKRYKKSLIDVPAQVIMRADPSSVPYGAWIAAALNRNTIFDLLILNTKRTVRGGRGIRGNFLVSLSDEAQVLADGVYTTFDLRPTDDTANNVIQIATVSLADGTLGFVNFTY